MAPWRYGSFVNLANSADFWAWFSSDLSTEAPKSWPFPSRLLACANNLHEQIACRDFFYDMHIGCTVLFAMT